MPKECPRNAQGMPCIRPFEVDANCGLFAQIKSKHVTQILSDIELGWECTVSVFVCSWVAS